MTPPHRAIVYLRLSDGRREDSFPDRERKLRRHAQRLGWTVTRVIIENDLMNGARTASAFKRRRVRLPDGRVELRVYRPGFRAMLDDLAAGRADCLLAEDLDRTMRDPRDAEDLIDVVRARGLDAASLSGSLTFTAGGTDAEVLNARILVSVANKASADTGRRVAEARERQARGGRFGGGGRRYGFRADGVSVDPAEAAVILDCARRLVQGVSLRSLALELRQRAVPTVSGRPWTAETLRDIMLRPRNAARVVYRGEVLADVSAPWSPIVPAEVHDEVVRLLTDPARRTGPGAPARWLGTGIYRCGICTPPGSDTAPVTLHVSGACRSPHYRCEAVAHLSRIAEPLDAYIGALVTARLARPDAVDLLAPPPPDVDAAALRAERTAIRARLNQYAADEVLGLRDRDEVLAASHAGKTRMAAIDAQLAATVVASPLAGLVDADDVAAAWARLPLANRRAVVDTLMVVTVMPTLRRGPGFDPRAVLATPRVPA